MSIYSPGDPEYLGFIDNNGDGISDIGGAISPIENKSFALLRTNPRLTTNIKVIVDSNESMYLGSFKANKELSKVEFQKYPIKSSGSFSTDIAKFYKNIPLSLRYQILKKYSDLTVYSDFANQYETHYQYGATHNSTKLYDEQYRLFAPIWLDKNTPKKFVVYRVDDVDYKEKYEENLEGQNNRVLELLNNATIIKTFDLTKNSEIGKYIYKHVNDKEFPNGSITMNFKEREKSFYNGIDIVKGGFASKSEVLDTSYTSVDYPEILSNEIITKGFARHGLVSANIMNLEFLFDDYTAEDYKIYRYFGIYCDDFDEGSFRIDNIDSLGFVSPNVNSYKTYYNIENTSLTDIDMLLNNEDILIPTLNYIKDKNGEFYHVKNGSKNIKKHDLPISLNGSSISDFKGFSKTGKRLTAIKGESKAKGFIKITINQNPNINDRFFIGDKSEIEIENNNLGQFTFIADNSITAGSFVNNRFSSIGNLEQVASAISQSIKSVSLIEYKVYVNGTSIIIEDFLDGNRRRQTAFGIFKLNNTNFITINDGELETVKMDPSIISQWDIITPIAGSSNNELIYVDYREIGELNIGEYIKSKNIDKFSKIIEINKDPFDENLWRVILEKPVELPKDMVLDLYDIYSTKHGKFAAYDFKDFDFDFYSNRNSNTGDIIVVPGDEEYAEPIDYFSWLTPVLSDNGEDEEISETILNEYDRLNENELKDTALKSRIVPTVCKFQLKDASNAKNLEYVLNASEAFGSDNMSPNIEVSSERNTEYLNMEHFHINKIPNYYLDYPEIDLMNYSTINMGGTSEYLTPDNLKDINFNYFKHALLFNGYLKDDGTIANPKEWIDNKLKVNYSKFRGGNTQGDSSTVFRGLRYNFKKRKESIKEEPSDFINTFEVNDYKFATIVNYTDTSTDENTITFEVIKNDVFKFICVYINIKVIDNDVKYLDRYSVYSLNDITKNGEVIDTDIPFDIDMSGSSWGSVDGEATITASVFSIADGSADFEKYITLNSVSEYSWIAFDFGGETWAMKVRRVIDKSRIIVQGYPYRWDTVNNIPTTSRLSSSEFGLIGLGTQFTYLSAGSNEFSNILEQLNAYNFAERFNKYGDIEYTTILKDGSIVKDQFVLSVESGTDFIKPSLVKPNTDPEKPKAYQLKSGSIGDVIVEREDGGYITVLRRMNGDYNPIFNKVVGFTDIYTSYKIAEETIDERKRLIYNKFNYQGISFESHKNRENSFGYIENYFYHKVNDENSKGVLKLSQTTDKLPIYPKIGEIAIDKKNINLFKSKYAFDFFSKSFSAGRSELVNGTLSPIEKENFFCLYNNEGKRFI